jgi:hypothetical protein
MGKTMKLFFPPFPQTLEIDEADFHIPTASAAATRRIISSKPAREGIRLLGIRPFIYIYKVGPN